MPSTIDKPAKDIFSLNYRIGDGNATLLLGGPVANPMVQKINDDFGVSFILQDGRSG